MKKTFTLLLFVTSFSPVLVFSQYVPGLPANFGIDGDVISGYKQNGIFQANNTDDWFLKSGNGQNLGKGIIDTTGAQNSKTLIAAGNNYTFTRGMIYPRYSEQNGLLMLDARYGRDEFGYSVTNGQKDFTTYTNGAKNGDNPALWITNPSGATVQNKSDIIDTYIHMRRNGTVINNTNPSPLILAMGVSTVGNTGERYVDFELFRERVEYNTTTGIFSNSGSAATGGHSAWEFNADGSIKNLGDISVSFTFGNGIVSEISIYIWVSSSVYNTLNPSRFNFVAGEFWGNGNNPAWGYAKIVPDGGSPSFNAWGSASTNNYDGPVWGTTSKTTGNSGTNYSSIQYGAGDFAEVAIDITSLGIDPALSVGLNPCSPPYTRVMAKTRSSSSFTSALMDFTGPYLFLDAPTGPSKILSPATITCNQPTVTISAKDIIAGATYQWSTTNGNIISDPNQPTITVDKAGKYFLTAAIVAGCNTNTDSTTVTADYYKPVASASTSGVIDLNNPSSYVSLQGGDVWASQYNTPFGGSVGLTWKWSGPAGAVINNSSNRVASTTVVGTYTLEVTETRNGCKDTAETIVFSLQALPVKLNNFQGSKNKNNVQLQWNVGLNEIANTFEVERSTNGKDFATAALLFGTEKSGNETYSYNEVNEDTKVYYRLKMVDKSDVLSYSKILVFNTTSKNTNKLDIIGNSVTDKLTVSFQSDIKNAVELRILDMNGRMIMKQSVSASKGNNLVSISLPAAMNTGMYIASISSENVNSTAKFIKQ